MKGAGRSVGIRELRQHLSAHLQRVRRGETLTVTERGRVIAAIVPAPPDPRTLYEQWIAEGLIEPSKLPWERRSRPVGPVTSTRGSEVLQELREDRV